MNYKIVIPSYKRSDNFIVNDLIEKSNLDKSKIYIFVSNKEEEELYKNKFPDYKIVYEKPLNNLMEKHNFIVDYFDEGELIVVIEDDIKQIVKKKGAKVAPFYKLDGLIKIGFTECHKTGSKLWGISPTNNGFFMKSRCEKGFRIVAGYIFGMIIDKRIKVNVSQKHDYERTILNQIYFNGSIRFDGFGQVSASFTNKGGLQEQYTRNERMEAEIKTNDFLVKSYPTYVARKSRINKTFDEATELRLLKK